MNIRATRIRATHHIGVSRSGANLSVPKKYRIGIHICSMIRRMTITPMTATGTGYTDDTNSDRPEANAACVALPSAVPCNMTIAVMVTNAQTRTSNRSFFAYAGSRRTEQTVAFKFSPPRKYLAIA